MCYKQCNSVSNQSSHSDITIEQLIEAVKTEDLEFLEAALNKIETKEQPKNGSKAINHRSA